MLLVLSTLLEFVLLMHISYVLIDCLSTSYILIHYCLIIVSVGLLISELIMLVKRSIMLELS